ncbi:hypothetical protein BKN38_03235 [Helicobacter sp. CLO-3]|nr:hypothetical protein BKN38_03235 [Helicobacter sp. CLO-3]
MVLDSAFLGSASQEPDTKSSAKPSAESDFSNRPFYAYQIKLKFPSNVFRINAPLFTISPADEMTRDIFTTLSEREKTSLALLKVPRAKNRIIIIAKAPLSDELLGKSLGELAYTTDVSSQLLLDILKGYVLLAAVIFALFYNVLDSAFYRKIASICNIVISGMLAVFLRFGSDSGKFHQIATFGKIAISKKTIWILIAAVFVLAFGLRLVYMNQKEVFHIDEVWTVAISSSSKGCLWGGECKEGIYFGKELKTKELWHDKNIAAAFQDIKSLYKDANGDASSHTNFYYSLFRLWNVGMLTGDINWIAARGISFNLLVFCLAFAFGILLARRVFGTNLLAPLFLAAAFLNGAGISNTMYIREYALQECLVLAFCYCLARFFLDSRHSKAFIAGFILCTSALLLCGYFMVIFVGLSLICLVWLFRQSCANAKKLRTIILSSVALCFAVFPGFYRGFGGGHAKSAASKFDFYSAIQNLQQSLDAYVEIWQTHILHIGVIFVLLILLWFVVAARMYPKVHSQISMPKYSIKNANTLAPLNKLFFAQFSKEMKFVWLMGAVALIFGLGIMYLAPWKALRFVVASLPIVILAMVTLFAPFVRNGISALSGVAAIVFVASILYSLEVGFLRYPEPSIYNIGKVLQEKNDIHIPTIYNVNNSYMAGHIIPYFNDLRVYHVVMDLDEALQRAKELGEAYFISDADASVFLEKVKNEGFEIREMQPLTWEVLFVAHLKHK